MDKKEFYDRIKDVYFEDIEISFQNLKDMVCSCMPIFGKLEVRIDDDEENEFKVIYFHDIDSADCMFAPEGYEIKTEDTNMNSIALELTINKQNIIQIINSSFLIITQANKYLILFLGSLIGKSIRFEESK
jgi:hypothetical protein